MSLTSRQSNSSLADEFKTLAIKVSQLFEKENIEVLPFISEELIDYNELSEDQKKQANSDLKIYLDSIEATIADGWTLHASQKSMWHSLKPFGFTPASDIMGLIRDDHSIEIYTLDGIQVWRNAKTMELCSYSIEQIFCYSWQERYVRDESASNEIMTVLGGMASSPKPETVHSKIKNIVTEKFSEKKYVLDVEHEYLSPIFDKDTHKMVGFVVLNNAKVLDSKS